MLWLILGIVILLALIFILIIIKKKKHKTDYKGIFNIGVVFFIIGIVMGDYFFSILGLGCAIIGFINRKKWKKIKLTKKQKRSRMIGIVIAFVLAIILALIFNFYNERIDSFDECVKAGNPVMESYPRQCTDDGNTFVEEIKDIKPY